MCTCVYPLWIREYRSGSNEISSSPRSCENLLHPKIFTNLLHKSSNSNLNDLVSIIFYERIFHGDIDILIEYDNLKVNLKVFIIDKLLRNSSRGIGNLIYFLIYLSSTKRFESRSKCSSILLSNNLLSNQYPVSNIPY